MGVPAYLTTAAAATGISAINVSAGTTSSNVSAITFSNGSGVSFGFDGSNITATVATNYQSPGAYLTTAQPPGAYLTTAMQSDASSVFAGTGFTTATTAGTNIVGTLNTSGLSMGVPAYLTTGTAGAFTPRLDQVLDPNTDKAFHMNTNQVQFEYAGGGTFSTNATRQGLFELDFLGNAGAGAHGLYIKQTVGNQVDLHLVHIEAHDANVLPFHIEGSATSNMLLNQPIVFSTDETIFAIGSVPMIMGTQMSNSVANLNANFVQGKGSAVLAGTGFTTASTAGSDIVGTLSPTGLSMGVPAYLTTASGSGGGATLSFFQNPTVFNSLVQVNFGGSSVFVVPFVLPQAISADYIRFPTLMTVNASTFSGTTANTTWSGARSLSYAAAILTQMTGASSESLGYIASASGAFINQTSIEAGNTGSQYTVSIRITYPIQGSTSTVSYNYASTSASYVINSSGMSDFVGTRWMDLSFGSSLSAGNYWMLLARSISTGSNAGPSAMFLAGFGGNIVYGVAQANSAWGVPGTPIPLSATIMPGLGSISSGVSIYTTSSIGLSQLSRFTDNPLPAFQMIRRA
jgi:hypothetical protein